MLAAIGLSSCSEYNDYVLPVIGVYDARVVGVSGGFDMSIAADGGNRLIIDAPFDGDVWKTIVVKFHEDGDYKNEIDIPRQDLGDGVEIWGDGFYYDGNIQLDYKISFWGDKYNYKLIGNQY